MKDERAYGDSLLEQIKDKFNEVVGLPSGKITDVHEVPRKDLQAPRGTLTSDDAETLPQQNGTGIAVN
jgi:hypothetical protein